MGRALDCVDNIVVAGLRHLPDVRGKAAVAMRLKGMREHRRSLEGSWIIRTSDGFAVSMPRGSTMAWQVAATGYWDRDVISLVSKYIAEGTLVLDIGASLGLWTLPLGRAAKARNGLLWCFEPNPDNIEWLTDNVERSALGDVTEVRAEALGSRAGALHLGYRETGGGNGALHEQPRAGSITVPVTRLDDLTLPCRVSFVKMDVEGFEFEILRGASEVIERDRPVIFGEYSADWLRIRGEDLAIFISGFAERYDYDVFAVEQRRSAIWRPKDRTSLRRIKPPFLTGTENLLLVPAAQTAVNVRAQRIRRAPA